jgi:hypothetical protein
MVGEAGIEPTTLGLEWVGATPTTLGRRATPGRHGGNREQRQITLSWIIGTELGSCHER